MSLVGYLFFRVLFLYGLFRVIKYAFTKVGIDINKVTKTKTFAGFVLVTTSIFSKTLRGFLSTLSVPVKLLLGIDIGDDTKYEGFMTFLERYFLLNRYNKGLLLNGSNNRLSLKNSFTHALVVAKTGGGKTSSFIIPNILELNDCSILTTDLSGELYQKTSGRMEAKGFNIMTINLIDPNKSNTFNPLEDLETDQEILEVAEVLLHSSNQHSADPFWDRGAKTLITILISCLVNQKRNEGTRKFCNLPNLRYLINNFGKLGAGIENFIIKYADNRILHEWKGFISGSEKTTQGFVSTALNALAIVSSDTISRIIASNEIDFQKIRKEKTIVYLMIPQHELNTYSFLLNLFYTRFFKTCYTNNSKQNLPVYCLLDEAGHTQIPHLATIITTIRKYKVNISLILQSLSQLKTAYGETASRTIMEGGVASQIFYGGCDYEMCETLSKILGNTTEVKKTHDNKTQTIIKPLMTPQAIRMIPDNKALYLFSNKKPNILKLKPYYKQFILNSQTKLPAHKTTDRVLPKVEYINLDN